MQQVRTAYRGAESYHNSNRITFKTLRNFRALAGGLLTLSLGEAAQLQPPFERDVVHYTASLARNATVIPVTLGGTGTFTVDSKQVKVVAGSGAAQVPFPLSVNSTTVVVQDVSTGGSYAVGTIPSLSLCFSLCLSVCFCLPLGYGSRALGLCPETTCADMTDCERVRPTSVRVTGSGFSVGSFENGSLAFLNREYVWRAVPPAVAGWHHTRTNGGQGVNGAAAASIHADVLEDCVVYATVGVSATAAHAALQKAGFEETSLEVEYTDANDTRLKLYRRTVVQGAQFSLAQTGSGWYGVQLVFP